MTDSTKQVSADLSSMIDTLLADTKISASAGKISEADLQVLLSGLMEADMSYSWDQQVVCQKQASTRSNKLGKRAQSVQGPFAKKQGQIHAGCEG